MARAQVETRASLVYIGSSQCDASDATSGANRKNHSGSRRTRTGRGRREKFRRAPHTSEACAIFIFRQETATMKLDNPFLDAHREALRATLDIMKVTLQGAERIRAHQMKMITQSLEDCTRNDEEIESASN